MAPRVQIKRTEFPNRAPTGLAPGELAVEMANPVRLWVGVPMTLDSAGRKLIVDGGVSAIDAYSKSESDQRFVKRSGDIMTGDLSINKVNPTFILNKASSAGQDNTIQGWTAGQRRWRVILGTTTPENGGNVGSDLAIVRHDDNGVTIDTPFAIWRNTGRTEILGLDVRAAIPNIVLNKTAADSDNKITGSYNGSPRWIVDLGNQTPENVGNVGNDFMIVRFDNSGNAIDTPWRIYRSDGKSEIRAVHIGSPNGNVDIDNGGAYAAHINGAGIPIASSFYNGGINAALQGVKHSYFLGRAAGSEYLSAEVNLISTGAYDGGAARSAMFRINMLTADMLNRELDIGNGIVCGAPSGGAKGVGTLNASAVYDDGTVLSCYVIEAACAGQINLAHWDDLAGGRNERAHQFAERTNITLDPRSFAKQWKDQGFLPGAPDPTVKDDMSMGQRANMLLELIEVQAVHIDRLTQEIDELKGLVANLLAKG